MTRLDRAPFSLADESLLPDAGPCTTCPKRTGANPDLFSDVGDADVCTDPKCFAAKKEAFQDRARQTAIARGKTVISGKAAEKIKPHQYGSELKGYVQIDDSPWWMDSDKKIKNVLKGSMPETVLIEDPHTGDLIEAIPEDTARTALKEAGVKISRATSSSSADQRDKEKKTKAERTGARCWPRSTATRARTSPRTGNSHSRKCARSRTRCSATSVRTCGLRSPTCGPGRLGIWMPWSTWCIRWMCPSWLC